MSSLLGDVMKGDELGTPMFACFLHGLSHLGLEFGVEDEIYIGIGITLGEIAGQITDGRTEGEEVLRGIALMLHLPQRRIGPRVVGSAKDQDDIGTSQVAGTGDERAVSIIIAIIARIAYGGSTVGIVGIELEASLLAE